MIRKVTANLLKYTLQSAMSFKSRTNEDGAVICIQQLLLNLAWKVECEMRRRGTGSHVTDSISPELHVCQSTSMKWKEWKELLAHQDPCRSSQWGLPVQRMWSTSAADPQGAAVCPQHVTQADFWAGPVRRLAWPEIETLSAAPSGVKDTPTAAHFQLRSFHSQEKWAAKKPAWHQTRMTWNKKNIIALSGNW